MGCLNVQICNSICTTDSGSGRVLDFDKLEGPETNRRPHLTILDGPKFPIILEESDTKTGLSGPALVIKPGVLKQGWTYIVELKIWNTGCVAYFKAIIFSI